MSSHTKRYASIEGIGLFFFGAVVLSVIEGNKGTDVDWRLWTNRSIGIIAIVASVFFLAGALRGKLADRLEVFFEGEPVGTWQHLLQPAFHIVAVFAAGLALAGVVDRLWHDNFTMAVPILAIGVCWIIKEVFSFCCRLGRQFKRREKASRV